MASNYALLPRGRDHALASLEAGQVRTEGVYLPELALGAARPAGYGETNWLGVQLKDNPVRMERFVMELNRHNLNNAQHAAAMNMLADGPGTSLIVGPAGSGKTKTAVACLSALMAAGFKVLVTSATKSALTLMEAELSQVHLPADVHSLDIVSFEGTSPRSFLKKQSSAEYITPKDEWKRRVGGRAFYPRVNACYLLPEEVVAATGKPLVALQKSAKAEAAKRKKAAEKEEAHLRIAHEGMRSEIAMLSAYKSEASATGMDYASQKMKFILQCVGLYEAAKDGDGNKKLDSEVSELESRIRSIAVDYQGSLENLLRLWRVREDARLGNHLNFRGLDEFFDVVYLERLSAVFCINRMSDHGKRRHRFEPDVLIMLQAAECPAAQAIIPMAAFKESTRAVVMVGDHKQLRPVTLTRGKKESTAAVSISLFEKLFSDPQKSCPRTVLDVQYRMCPELSLFPREKIYGDVVGLRDDSTVKASSETHQKVATLLKPLADAQAWNGRPRLAIDCLGMSENTVLSMSNWSEATLSAAIVDACLKSGIEATDIAVIAPYPGQCDAIKNLLSDSGTERINEVRVLQTRETQGVEAEIVVISFVEHELDANQVECITEEDLLTVELTRARSFLFLLGNFGGWTSTINKNDPDDFLIQKEQSLFSDFVKDLLEHQDIVCLQDWEEVLLHKRLPLSSASWHRLDPSAPRYQPKPRPKKGG